MVNTHGIGFCEHFAIENAIFDILEYALLFSMVVLRESITKCESLAIC